MPGIRKDLGLISKACVNSQAWNPELEIPAMGTQRQTNSFGLKARNLAYEERAQLMRELFLINNVDCA